jgi:hypothetical protein
MRRNTVLILALFGLFTEGSLAKTHDVLLEPAGVELSVYPGNATTTGFLVKTDGLSAVRNGLVLSLADWEVSRDGIVIYKEPGTVNRSASGWISIHPITLPMAAETRLVRLTVQIPAHVVPGLYISAVIVEPVIATQSDVAPSASKLFHVFTIYVTVPPPHTNRPLEVTFGR